jgi:hypothetical protein
VVAEEEIKKEASDSSTVIYEEAYGSEDTEKYNEEKIFKFPTIAMIKLSN